MTGTGESRDASGLSILDFHPHELAGGVGRDVKIAVAAEGDPVEPGAALRRSKGGILCEYFERRGARGESENGGMRAVGDVYGARGVHGDVVAERVRAGQRDAALANSRLEVKALQRAPRITTGC